MLSQCGAELQVVVGQVRTEAPLYSVRCARGQQDEDPHGVHTGETQYGDGRLVLSWSGA